MASRANIYIDQGTDFRVSIELFDADDEVLVIDTYKFYSSIKKLYSSPPLADFRIEKANNEITLILTSQQTSEFKPGKYQYDVIMEKTTGERSKIAEGLAFIVDTITEAP